MNIEDYIYQYIEDCHNPWTGNPVLKQPAYMGNTGLNDPTWELVILVSKSPVGYPIELVMTMDTNYCALFTMVISTDHQLYI